MKNTTIHVRVTEKEKKDIQKEAKKESARLGIDISLSCFIRQLFWQHKQK